MCSATNVPPCQHRGYQSFEVDTAKRGMLLWRAPYTPDLNAAHMHHPYCTVSPLATHWVHGLCPGAGGPICPGISCAPSAFNLSNVLFLWYSITLLFLKYVTYPTISFIIIVAGHPCLVSAASPPCFCSAARQNVPNYSHNSSRILSLPLSMPSLPYPFP
jgi:hypothetical protein